MLILQEGIIRAQLYKALNGTKDVIYEEAHASEEGFKAVSIIVAFNFVHMIVSVLLKEDTDVKTLFCNESNDM